MNTVENKYLVFNLESEDYGIALSNIREVMRFVNITPLHESNRFLKGVINLRGKIIPIVDMRTKFGIQEKPYDDRTIFIIVEFVSANRNITIGLAVDRVFDVIDLKLEDIDNAATFGLRLKSNYLSGMARFNDRILMLLNIDSIIGVDDVVRLQDTQLQESQIQETAVN